MVRRQLKLWCALGVGSVAGLAANAGAPAPEDLPGGSVAHALEKIFEGEGGEGGLGFTKLRPSFTVPALTDNQLRQVFTGNTLAQRNSLSVHFGADGKLEGWRGSYNEVDLKKCPEQDADDGLWLKDGRCLQRGKEQTVDGASWSVDDGRLCVPDLEGLPGGPTCYYAALVLNNVVLFTEEGRMIGKGKDLLQGKQLAAPPRR